MRALSRHGKHDIRYYTIPNLIIEHPRDAIIKASACAICGSDLHLFDGFIPGMKSGDIMGHEFMGEVVVADRVPERLSMAKAAGATTINFDEESVVERLNELTGVRGRKSA